MDELIPAEVEIYCKIGCDQFPTPSWCDERGNIIRKVYGHEIVDFLLQSSNYFGYESSHPEDAADDWISDCSDKLIWVLCTNEKSGILRVDDFEVRWGMSESSPNNVLDFVNAMFQRKVINEDHRAILVKEIQFCVDNFEVHYDIDDYLELKREGRLSEWKKPEGHKAEQRASHAKMFSAICKHFKSEGMDKLRVGGIDVDLNDNTPNEI